MTIQLRTPALLVLLIALLALFVLDSNRKGRQVRPQAAREPIAHRRAHASRFEQAAPTPEPESKQTASPYGDIANILKRAGPNATRRGAAAAQAAADRLNHD